MTTRHNINNRLMLRIDAIGLIWANGNGKAGESIADIAENRQVSMEDASRIYVIAACKAAKRRGQARNYQDAIEQIEQQQAGDNSYQLVSTDLNAEVARINRINQAGDTKVYQASLVQLDDTSWLPTKAYIGTMEGREPQVTGRDRAAEKSRKIGKVMGDIYAQWESRIHDNDVMVQDNVRRYIEDYVSRLSKTMRGKILMLQQYNGDIGDLMKASNKTDKLHNAINYLHRSFPHRDNLTATDLADLVVRYAPRRNTETKGIMDVILVKSRINKALTLAAKDRTKPVAPVVPAIKAPKLCKCGSGLPRQDIRDGFDSFIGHGCDNCRTSVFLRGNSLSDEMHEYPYATEYAY
jgi:hypothetical protein